jgi:hypothetical protein
MADTQHTAIRSRLSFDASASLLVKLHSDVYRPAVEHVRRLPYGLA